MKTKKIIITIEDDEGTPYVPVLPNSGWLEKPYYNDPCANCPNNPMNNPHATGFCNCALPALMNPIY